MARIDKEKAAGISSSSFFDLKAQLANQKDEIAKMKASGDSSTKRDGHKDQDKKISKWARSNKNVDKRAARDIQLEEVHKPTYDSARIVLERKAAMYEKLKKGQTGGLTDAQFDALLVDFDAKPDDSYEPDSDDVDESLTIPQEPRQDDPIIEYEDEFGRMRSAPRSEVPRHLLPLSAQPGNYDHDDADEGIVLENPHGYFPTYEPSAERRQALEAAAQEADEEPLNVHYDASREVRAKGAAFYNLSADEETRRKQQEELMRLRMETQKAREEKGAVDLRPGELEGMRPEDGKAAAGAEGVVRAGEKRKRDLEERRRKVEEARKKAKAGNRGAKAAEEPASTLKLPSGSSSFASSTPTVPSTETILNASSSTALDPFAALEAQAFPNVGQANDSGRSHPAASHAVDAFLAAVQPEFKNGR